MLNKSLLSNQDEKAYCDEFGNYILPKKILVKEIFRGDLKLKDKIIIVPFFLGRCSNKGELEVTSHGMPRYKINDEVSPYFFISNIDDKGYYLLNKNGGYGGFDMINNVYCFDLFCGNEKKLFTSIINTKNYNPKTMLEAGMKIPEKEKKAVGFLVKETEKPNDKNK